MVTKNNIQNNNNVNQQMPRSAVTALLFCAFLGWLGIHRFYLGKAISGFIMLICSITFVLSFITVIWAFIDLLRLLFCNLKDVNNNKLLIENKTVFITIAIILGFFMLFPLTLWLSFMMTFIMNLVR